jgi:hypothetical protein
LWSRPGRERSGGAATLSDEAVRGSPKGRP